MKKIILCFVFNLLWAQLAYSQMGRQNFQNRNYDPNTKIEIEGTIEDLVTNPARHSNGTGYHLKLKTDNQTWSVHLGPKWFFDEHKVKLSKNMKIEVEGSVIQMDGESVVVAKEIESPNGEIKIRDDNGQPFFSRQQRMKNKLK